MERELYEARHDLVDLMPGEISQMLGAYYLCKSSEDYARWEHETIHRIISMAKPDPKLSFSQDSARCPLCREGSQPYNSGFTLPEGLHRHLLGKGNAHRCPVLFAAFRNARYSLREKLEAWKREEKEQEADRRRTEQLFLIDPRRPPRLIDENTRLAFLHGFRTAEEIPAAEQRLRELGFQVEVQGNVVAHKLLHDSRLVLADPRIAGRIYFLVLSDEKPTKQTKDESFYLLDSWKNDIAGKFRERLKGACSTFPPSRAP